MLKHIMALLLLQNPTFEHRFGQFLDEQRHAVRASEDLVHPLRGQRLAAGDPLDDGRPVRSAKARESDRRDMRVMWPGRCELWACVDEQQHPKLRHLVHHEREQFKRGHASTRAALGYDSPGRVTNSLGNSSRRFHDSTFESATFFASASGSARNLSAHTGASAATTASSERSFAILSAVLPSDQPPQ